MQINRWWYANATTGQAMKREKMTNEKERKKEKTMVMERGSYDQISTQPRSIIKEITLKKIVVINGEKCSKEKAIFYKRKWNIFKGTVNNKKKDKMEEKANDWRWLWGLILLCCLCLCLPACICVCVWGGDGERGGAERAEEKYNFVSVILKN